MGCLFSYPCLKGLRGYGESAKDHPPPIERDMGNIAAPDTVTDDEQSTASIGKCVHCRCRICGQCVCVCVCVCVCACALAHVCMRACVCVRMTVYVRASVRVCVN